MKQKKNGTIFIIVGMLLVVAALCIIGYNVFTQWNAGNSSYQILTRVEKECINRLEKSESDPISEPVYVSNPLMEMPVITIDGYDYIGVIIIPAINIELPVQSQWSYEGMQIAPGRYSGSAYLNNLVLCAHNFDTHFGRINTLIAGDDVIFVDFDGNEFYYEVVNMEIIEPTAIEDMTFADDWDLTLFTCNLAGSARVTVRCESLK